MNLKKSKTIGFRITESLKEALSLIAERETRTVSLQVEYFIRKGIKEYTERNPDFDVEQNTFKSSKGKQ